MRERDRERERGDIGTQSSLLVSSPFGIQYRKIWGLKRASFQILNSYRQEKKTARKCDVDTDPNEHGSERLRHLWQSHSQCVPARERGCDFGHLLCPGQGQLLSPKEKLQPQLWHLQRQTEMGGDVWKGLWTSISTNHPVLM